MTLSSESLLDHIANFLKCSSPAHNCSGFHLIRATAMAVTWPVASVWTPTSVRRFSFAGLALYTRFGFQIKAGAWRKFLGGCQFVIDNCAIEVKQKKIDLDAYINRTPPSQLKQKKFYVVRIGSKSEQSPNIIEEQIGWDGRLITTPTRVNGIGIKT